MGMAASQGRLLFITGRLSDIEFSSQQKTHSKIRLAMDTEQITAAYVNALNKKEFVAMTGYENGAPTYSDLTFDVLTGVNSPLAGDYCLTDSSNRVLVSQDMATKFTESPSKEAFLAANGVVPTPPSGYTVESYNEAHDKLTDAVIAAQKKYDETPATKTVTAAEATALKNKTYTEWQSANSTYNTAKTSPTTFTTNYSDSLIILEAGLDKYYSGSSRSMQMSTSRNTSDWNEAETNLKKVMNDWFGTVNSNGTFTPGKLGNALSGSLSDLGDTAKGQVNAAMVEAYNNTYKLFTDNEVDRTVFPSGIVGMFDTRDGHDHQSRMDCKVLIDTFLTCFDQACAKLLPNGVKSREDSVLGKFKPPSNPLGIFDKLIDRPTVTRKGSGGTGDDNSVSIAFTADDIVKLKQTADDLYKLYQSIDPKGGVVDNPDKLTAQNELTLAKNAVIDFEAATSTNNVTTQEETYYTNLYNRMSAGYVTMGDEKNTINNKDWIYNQIKNGGLHLEQFDAEGKAVDKNISTSTEILEVRDTEDLDIVKAKYDSDLLKIQNKDKKLDMEIKQLDTEHNALQTEFESVQKVIQKNIESSFKTFG